MSVFVEACPLGRRPPGPIMPGGKPPPCPICEVGAPGGVGMP